MAYFSYRRLKLNQSVGGLLGTAGGAAGSGFKAPGSANIIPGTDQAQISQANGQVQNSLASQQELLNALQSQSGLTAQNQLLGQERGLQNQLGANAGAANVGSAYQQAQHLANQQAGLQATGAQGTALSQQQAMNNQLSGAAGSGIQAQQSALAAQQDLAAQYQGIANGTGPNPAQAMLNQQTGANVANQAALMAGQRGAASNVGLIARQAAQQGAATQQQAVGQGATMQAQQSLNALGQIGNTQSNIASQGAGLVGQAQSGIGAAQGAASNITAQQQAQQQALAGQAAAQVGQQQTQQQLAANQANTMAGQQIAQTQNATQANLSNAQLQQQTLAAQNNANVAMQSNINSANAGLAGQQMQGQQGIIGGTANAVGAGVKMALAEGGEAKKPKKMAYGEPPVNTAPAPVVEASTAQTSGPQSGFGKFLKGAFAPQNKPEEGAFSLANSNNKGAMALQQGFGNLGSIGGMFKSEPPKTKPNAYTGADVNTTSNTMAAAKGGMAKKRDFTSGGNVKASNEKQKAVKSGNSYDNDKIPAMLSEGEVVIPRDVMQGKDPIRGAADFVAKVMAKRGRT